MPKGRTSKGSVVIAGLETLWEAFRANWPELPEVFLSISHTDPYTYGWTLDNHVVTLPVSTLQYRADTIAGVLLHEATHEINAMLRIDDTDGHYYHRQEFLDNALVLGLAHPQVRHPRFGWTTVSLTPATRRLYLPEIRNLQTAIRGG